MNEKTNEMIVFANNQKEILRQRIFDKLTLNPEEIINEINENLFHLFHLLFLQELKNF